MLKEVKIIKIGNSKGIRLPKAMIVKYGITESIQLEEAEDGILIKPLNDSKLSWEETYQQMAKTSEDWTDWHSFEDEANL